MKGCLLSKVLFHQGLLPSKVISHQVVYVQNSRLVVFLLLVDFGVVLLDNKNISTKRCWHKRLAFLSGVLGRSQQHWWPLFPTSPSPMFFPPVFFSFVGYFYRRRSARIKKTYLGKDDRSAQKPRGRPCRSFWGPCDP